jgi:catechol 2,3-dioxygenase-like lactoylglutathione lyase family enzyme
VSLVSVKALSHVAVRVTDLARAIAWYEAVLGYDVFRSGPAPTPDRTPHAMGLIGGVTLELLESASAVSPGPNAVGIIGLSLTVADVAAALEAVKAAGHKPLSGVIAAEDWKVAFLADPDGNIVELVQQPRGASSIAELAEALRARA